ncbi:hypothetical protein ADUPG1_003500, partial [Aduncisulcus paluster]
MSHLYACGNGWIDIYLLAHVCIDLVSLDLRDNEISDPSPLYILDSLSTLQLDGNNICGLNVEGAISNRLSESTVNVSVSDQYCGCSAILDDIEALALNYVCIRPAPTSAESAWYILCSSESYITYFSASILTCNIPVDAEEN